VQVIIIIFYASVASRGCKYAADDFCSVYGEFIKRRAKKHSLATSVRMNIVYKAYFGMPVGNQDKSWGPRVLAVTTAKRLWKVGLGEKRKACSLQYLEFGLNPLSI